MYIDETYYSNTYGGKEAGDEPPLSAYIKRACNMIDQLTNFKIDDLSKFHERIQDHVKKAVAAQTEFLVLNGLYSGNDNTPTNISIGIFNYSGGNNVAISPDAIAFLRPTGLLYAGVHVHDERLLTRWY